MVQNSSVELDTVTRERLSLAFLIGQSTSLGLTAALLISAASAIFLSEFGPDKLPYVYIATAIFVSSLFYGFAELQRRLPLSKLAIISVTSFAALLFVGWLILRWSNAAWFSFVLMVAFPLSLQLGFVLLGNQAGRLFNVRQIKRRFPLIITGFAGGFMLGGLAVSPLLIWLQQTENLLFVAGVCMLGMLGFLLAATGRFKTELDQDNQPGRSQPSKSLGSLLKVRYIVLIFLYQMLSAMGTQLGDFIFFSQASARYSVAEEFASFFGNFSAVLNFIDIVFVTLFAGFFLTRFGMRYGLMINPGVMVVMALAMSLTGLGMGVGGILFFALATATRILDIVLTDGATRTAINATYQALPAQERMAAQTGVEGIGVPVAMGLTGVVLLGVEAIPGLSFIHVVYLLLIITLFWLAAGWLVYNGYSAALIRTLRRRALGEVTLSLDDASSLAVVEKLVGSNRLSDIRLGLDMLQQAEHTSLESNVINLLAHPNADIRQEALTRVEQRKMAAGLPAVTNLLQTETNPAVKGETLRALCALQEADAVDVVKLHLLDPEPDVQRGALVGLLRYGGITGVVSAWEHMTQRLDDSTLPADRRLVAQVIGQVETQNFYHPLLPLLQDDDPEVRRAALVAAGQINHPRLLPPVIASLSQRQLRSTAMAALVAGRESVLPLVEKALADETDYDEETVIRLVRVCGDIKGEAVIQVLKQHLNHPDDDVQVQVLIALDRCEYRAEAANMAEIEHTLRGEVEHGLRILLAQQDIGQDQALTHLHRTLQYELEQARRRVFLLLSFVYDSRAVLRAEEQLHWGDKGQKALALETLDVTLTGQQKNLLFPLVDDSQPLEQRTQQLTKLFELTNISQPERLREIIADPTGVWTHGWTRACAIYAAGKLGVAGVDEVIEEALTITEHPVRETAAWALHTLAPERYQVYAAELATSADPQVADLAAHLAT